MKNVLITGGSRGIGSEMVRLFSESGYRVAFTYKNSESRAEQLAKETGALKIYADSMKEQDIKHAVDVFETEIGSVDILINNAAISSFSLFTDISLEEWNTMMSVNVTGAFLYTKYALDAMIRNKWGRIINISSMWGIVGSSCEVHYSTTKAALIGMTKALAKEVGPSGITVNCIAPGLINTEMNGSLSEDDLKEIIDSTPVMRMGEACDIAEAALFLASEKSSFITGNVINASGGFVV